MKSDNIIIECKDIVKRFRARNQEVTILNALNLQVRKGEIVVISGKSGVGKSTLIGLLAGLEQPTSGEIIFEGNGFVGLSNEKLASLRHEKIGIIFQSFNLLPSWSAFENVQTALMHRGLSKDEQYGKIEPLLNEFGLGDRKSNLPLELSVGEQQRIAVARALVNNPELILADEPVGCVDEQIGQEIIQHLVSMVRKNGTTMILATHGNALLDIGDRVFKLEGGTLLAI